MDFTADSILHKEKINELVILQSGLVVESIFHTVSKQNRNIQTGKQISPETTNVGLFSEIMDFFFFFSQVYILPAFPVLNNHSRKIVFSRGGGRGNPVIIALFQIKQIIYLLYFNSVDFTVLRGKPGSSWRCQRFSTWLPNRILRLTS